MTDKKRTRYEKTADDLANYRISQYPDVAKTLKDRHPYAFAVLFGAFAKEGASHVEGLRGGTPAPRGEARH
jgi:hypothetical protein